VPVARLRLGLFAIYGIVFVWSFFVNGLPIARLVVLAWVAAAVIIAHVGRPWHEQRRMTLDLSLYAAMWLSYDYSRGIADTLGFPVQVETPRNLDRILFFGTDPNVWVQDVFHRNSTPWYEVVLSLVYFTHFFLPVAVAVLLWITTREQWVRYIRRFATVLFGGVLMFVLLPTVPPWMAASARHPYRILPALARTTGRGWNELGLETVSSLLIRGQQWANPTAAFPSLHAAFALLVVVFFWPRLTRRWMRIAAGSFPALMAFSLVYFAEHYVVDILAGWALVAGSFWFWGRYERARQLPDPVAVAH
jgi:membrane-associated phospholipid phosphatase